MDKNKYLLMCEQLNKEPDPAEIPAGFGDFPIEVQDAIRIYSVLPDNWEGFGGTFLGKDYSILPFLCNEIYEIDDKAQLMQFLIIINNIVTKNRAREQKQRQKMAKQKHSK